jgi:fluoride ion exporter CrcB/FEX
MSTLAMLLGGAFGALLRLRLERSFGVTVTAAPLRRSVAIGVIGALLLGAVTGMALTAAAASEGPHPAFDVAISAALTTYGVANSAVIPLITGQAGRRALLTILTQ